MQTLSNELKGVLNRRIELARPHEIMAIAGALTALEVRPQQDISGKIEIIIEPPKPVIQPRFEIIQGHREPDLVRDNSSGLIWTRDNVPGGRLSRKDAEAACSNLDFGGFHDWRLPTIKELLTLVDYERHSPAIDTDAFNCEPSWYWTSTPLNSSPGDYAWGVFFGYGVADWGFRDSFGFVRAVRVGQF